MTADEGGPHEFNISIRLRNPRWKDWDDLGTVTFYAADLAGALVQAARMAAAGALSPWSPDAEPDIGEALRVATKPPGEPPERIIGT